MDKFVARENIRHFRDRLEAENNPTSRSLLHGLLVQEEDKLGHNSEALRLTQEDSMFRGGLKHPTFISLAAVGLATTLAQAGEIADKLIQKHQCQVIFDNSPTDCVGGPTSTIAKGTPGYTVSFDPATRLFTASGPICNAGQSQTHPDAGGVPAQGYLNVFGRPFRFDEEGNVYEVPFFGGARIGKITCEAG
jgi:hypothetical protein